VDGRYERPAGGTVPPVVAQADMERLDTMSARLMCTSAEERGQTLLKHTEFGIPKQKKGGGGGKREKERDKGRGEGGGGSYDNRMSRPPLQCMRV